MKNASLLIHPDELSYSFIDRTAAQSIPTIALHPPGGKHADGTMADLIDRLQQPEYRKMIDYAYEKGLTVEYEMHAARYLLPASEFEAHPQWFRMNAEGARTPDLNFCASNEEALDYVAERVAETVKKFYRSSHRYFLWLDDAKDSACHCPECAKLSPSDQQLKILNRIVTRLRKDDPEASLAYLAYFKCIQPPEVFKPAPGIFLEYAPYERDFHRPLAEDAQSESLAKLLEIFGTDGAKALDYWYDNSFFSKYKKPPKYLEVDVPVMQADFRFYRSLGIEDISCFACFLGPDYDEQFGPMDLSPFGKAYREE